MANLFLNTYKLCRDCLYRDARDGCLECCEMIFVVPEDECLSDMHPTPEDAEPRRLGSTVDWND